MKRRIFVGNGSSAFNLEKSLEFRNNVNQEIVKAMAIAMITVIG